MRTNADIYNLIRLNGLYIYQISAEMNVSETWFRCMLHRPLSEKKRSEIIEAVKRACERRGEKFVEPAKVDGE